MMMMIYVHSRFVAGKLLNASMDHFRLQADALQNTRQGEYI
jgi:hypothetical protein